MTQNQASPRKAQSYHNQVRTGDLRLARGRSACDAAAVNEIIFEVREDETDGGYVAIALGHAIATQGDSVEELREMVRDAVHCHFGDALPGSIPQIIRLHFVRDEALTT